MIKSNQPFRLILFFFFLLSFHFDIMAQSPSYEFVKKISLPTGNGKWDYLKMDEENNRIYVSHADRIHIVDLNTETQIGEIDNLKGVHGIALVSALQKGYITNGTDNSITVFDLKTFKVLSTIMVEGKKADAILYDNYSKRVFVFNNGSGNAIAIDPMTDKQVGKVEMGGAPEFGATNGIGSIYNNNEETNEIVEFDANTLQIKNRFSVVPGKVPTGLAYSKENNILFSVCRDPKLLVILHAKNGKIIDSIPIGGGTDAVVFDKKLKLVFASNGEGNVTIILQQSPSMYKIIQTLETKKGIKTMALNEKTHKIYLSGAELKEDGKTLVESSFGLYVYGLKTN